MSVTRRIVAALPDRFQFEVESQLRMWQLRRGRFGGGEPEYDLLPELVGSGDWVLDIGANMGHYTLELARLVGQRGRVISLEPMTRPFAQLTGLIARTGLKNVTLLNAAASDSCRLAAMEIPSTNDGLPLFYQASLQEGGSVQVMTIRIDDLAIEGPVSLIKVDVEGHEVPVLHGMKELIQRCRPVLIVEDSSPAIREFLMPLGYSPEKISGSPNLLLRPSGEAATA